MFNIAMDKYHVLIGHTSSNIFVGGFFSFSDFQSSSPFCKSELYKWPQLSPCVRLKKDGLEGFQRVWTLRAKEPSRNWCGTPWKINMEHNSLEAWKIIFLSKWLISRFHVNLPGCTYTNIVHISTICLEEESTFSQYYIPMTFLPPKIRHSRHKNMCGFALFWSWGLEYYCKARLQ